MNRFACGLKGGHRGRGIMYRTFLQILKKHIKNVIIIKKKYLSVLIKSITRKKQYQLFLSHI